jgi:hypothetical protein
MGRVDKEGGDRKSKKSLGNLSQVISDPRRRFSELFRANEKYASKPMRW